MNIQKKIVYINSKHRISGDIDSFQISFNDLQIPKDENIHVFMSVIDVVLTNSFYNIRSTNNKFQIDSTTIIVTIGNYNINQLVSTINSLVQDTHSHLTFTYNTITSKLKIHHTSSHTNVIDFNVNDSINEILGFERQSYSLTGNVDLFSPNICNIGTPQCLYLLSNVSNENLQSDSHFHLSKSDILCKIPILAPNFSNCYYHSSGNDNYRQQIDVTLDTAIFSIVDQDFNTVGLNRDYCFTLLFQFEKKYDDIAIDSNKALNEIMKLNRLNFIKEQ